MSSRSKMSLVPALLLSFLVGAFRVGDHGLIWLWSGRPDVAIALALAAAAFWVLLFVSTREGRQRPAGDRVVAGAAATSNVAVLQREDAVALDAARARRAIGAMFLFPFGGAWIGFYAWQVVGGNPLALIAVVLVTLALLVLALRCYRRHRPALMVRTPTLQQRRAMRVFHIVNVGQWVAIFVAINVLVNLGLPSWEIPCVMLIVGLHFLPLAHVFAYRMHYITGAALIGLAAIYPLFALHGPANPIGCLGAGFILWASAFWAITMASNPRRMRQQPGVA